jgi:hypothetical protein
MITMTREGAISAGFTGYTGRASMYATFNEMLRQNDLFQRSSAQNHANRTGNIPLWRVGGVIALGVGGKG